MEQKSFTSIEGFGHLPQLLESSGGTRRIERVFVSAGVPLSLAFQAQGWIPLSAMMSLLERTARELGDDLFGLHLGETMQPADFGLWASYAQSAADLKTAIERGIRTLPFHQSGANMDLEIFDGKARWLYKILEPISCGRRHHSDHALLPMLTFMRRYLGPRWVPRRVEVGYDRPLHWRQLEERFGAPVVFACAADAIVFDSHLLERRATRKVQAADRFTYSDLRRVASRKPPRNLVDGTREIIRTRLKEPLTDIEGVARLLNVSRRTLQRELDEYGLNYRQVLEQVRTERAFDLLIESQDSITDIALSLGYGDVPSFTRAFRRWKGSPPSDFRRASGHVAAQEPIE